MTEENKVEEKQERKKMADNVVYIGQKPFMNYINACQRIFQNHNELFISARGKNISRAVDVAEFITKKIMKEENIEIEEIKIDSEEFEPREENKNHKKISVSSIEIKLLNKQKDLKTNKS